MIIWRNKKYQSKSGTLETSLRWTDSHDVQLHLLWISNFCSIFCFCWASQVREEVVVEPRGLFRIKAKVGQGEIDGEACRLETVRDVVEECWRMSKVVKTLLVHRSLHFFGASHKSICAGFTNLKMTNLPSCNRGRFLKSFCTGIDSGTTWSHIAG